MRLELLALAAVVVAFPGCVSTKPVSKSAAVLNAPAPTNDQEIVIWEFRYLPSVRTVPVGTTVTWVNHDVAPHTATYSSFGDEAFDSGNMMATQIFKHRFRTAGTYAYLCTLHQGMRGTVVVE